MTRDLLERFITQNGGRIVAGVSAKTDYLVTGKVLEDQRPVTAGGKYQRAVKLKKKIMTEKEFELFCRERFRDPNFSLEEGVKNERNKEGGSIDEFMKMGKHAGLTQIRPSNSLHKDDDSSEMIS